MAITQSLTGKRALICGASAGIGRAIAIQLAALGAECILLARRSDRLKNVQEMINQKGGSASIIIGDLDNLEKVITKVKIELRRGAINILINNTGGQQEDRSSKQLKINFSKHSLVMFYLHTD